MASSDDPRATLKRAYQLIKDGEKQQARKIVGGFLKANPRSADGWYLAALLTSDPDKKLKIVERVLEIAPDHGDAKKLLNELTSGDELIDDLLHETDPSEEKSPPQPGKPKTGSNFLSGRAFWMAIVVLVVLIVVGGVFVLGRSRGELLGIVFRASVTPLPTATNTPRPTRTPTPTSTPSPTVDSVHTATAIALFNQKVATSVALTQDARSNSNAQNAQFIATPTIPPTWTPYVFPSQTPTSTPENLLQQAVQPLDFNIREAAYDSTLQKIIAAASDANQLHIYDPETNIDQTVNLPRATTSLSISPDGLFAAVGHDALISYVDLQNAKLVKTLDIPMRVGHLALAGNGWVYVAGSYSQFDPMVAVEIASGKLANGPQLYGENILRVHPDGKKIYGADRGLSPDDIQRYDIGPDGFADPNQYNAMNSPYHGDYYMCGDLWLSEDGQRIFTACGAVFRASDNPGQDMSYNGSLTGLPALGYVRHSQPAGIVVGLSLDSGRGINLGGPFVEDKMAVWDYENLTLIKMMTLPDFAKFPSHGRYVFINPAGTRYYVILEADQAAGLANDFGLLAGDVSELGAATSGQTIGSSQTNAPQGAITPFSFEVIDAAYSTALDRVIAISGSPNQLHVIDPTSLSDTTVDLPQIPLSLSVSPDGFTAAVGHTSVITMVNLKTAQVTATLKVSIPADNVALAGNDLLYVASPSDRNQSLIAVRISTDTEIKGPFDYGDWRQRLHPDGMKIYSVDNQYMYRFDLSDTGFKEPVGNSSATSQGGNYCGNLWFSHDGQRIYTACGGTLWSSDDPAKDMTYAGTFDVGELKSLGSLVEVGGLVLAVPQKYADAALDSDKPKGNLLGVWETKNLMQVAMKTLPDWQVSNQLYQANGRFIFANAAGTQYYVIVQADSKAGLLNDFGFVSGSIADLSGTGGEKAASSSQAGAITPLDFNVTDAEYSTALDRIIAVSEDPNEIHIYDPVTHTDSALHLSDVPLSVSVSPDGKTAAVGHSNTITIIDLVGQRISTIVSVSASAKDIVLGGNGWVYVASTYTDERAMRAVQIATNKEIPGPPDYGDSVLRLDPDGQKMYSADNGLSPADIHRFDLTPDGFTQYDMTHMTDSPYHGDYGFCGNLWFSTDGTRIFTACRETFHASNDATDMTYAGSLQESEPGLPRLGNLLQVGGLLLGLPEVPRPMPGSATEPWPNQLYVWEAENMNLLKVNTLPDWQPTGQPYPATGRFIFASAAGTQYFVIVEASKGAGLLHDYGIISANIADLTASGR